MRLRRLDMLLLLTIAGVAVAGYLSWAAVSTRVELACGGFGDCKAVQHSPYARIAGVPIALLGLGMYAALAAMTAARRFFAAAPAQTLAQLALWTFALALGGVAYSAYLTYLELFVIDKICVWCVASALIVTACWLLTLPDVRRAGDGGRSDL